MALLIAIPTTAITVAAATGASATITAAMTSGQVWELCANTAIYYTQGSSPVASAAVGTGSSFLGAGATVRLDGVNGANVAVIADAVTGKATLTRQRLR